MYHSVYFGNMNSFSDWHLVPDSRPVISLPELKEVTVDMPGAQGTIDLSEALTKYPLYGKRTGSLKFHVLNGYSNWKDLYETIANTLHGKNVSIRLEDDPDWTYTGKCKVTWESKNDGSGSDVSIDYILDPFKKYKNATSVSTTLPSGTTSKNVATFSGIKSFPVIPTVNITSNSTTGLVFYVVNSELGLTKNNSQMSPISTTGSKKLYSCVLSNMSGSNSSKLYVTRTSGTSGAAECTFTYDRVML